MQKSKCYLNTNYSNKFRKRFVQTFFYLSSKVRGNVLMLCGPAIEEHLHDAKIILIGTSKCIIYENNRKTWEDNKKYKPKYFGYILNIKLDNIINAKIQRFIDLDFCNRLNTNIVIIRTIFNKMQKLNTLNKHLLITFTNKGSKRDKDIETLCKTFNITNDFIFDNTFPGLIKYKHRIVNATFISYRDGMPMTTFSYQWK